MFPNFPNTHFRWGSFRRDINVINEKNNEFSRFLNTLFKVHEEGDLGLTNNHREFIPSIF